LSSARPPMGPLKIWFSIKSIHAQIPVRAANGLAGIWICFLETPKYPEPLKRRPSACRNWTGERRLALTGTPVHKAPCRLTLEGPGLRRAHLIQVAGIGIERASCDGGVIFVGCVDVLTRGIFDDA